MSLKRHELENYARKHWYTPCHDGILYSYTKGNVKVEAERQRLQKQGKLPGGGWRAVLLPELDSDNKVVLGKERGCFIRESAQGEEIVADIKPAELKGKFDIVPFYQVAGDHDGLVDCAHYVSCCLSAGGVPINQPGVPGLVHELRARHDTRTLGLEITLDRGQRVLNTGIMKVGDIVAYVHDDPKTHQRGYAHSAIYMGLDAKKRVHRISCHTTARFREFFADTPWNITVDKDWRFTLIHFADEVFPPLPQPLRFEVVQGRTSEVYDFKPKGHVVRFRGPASAHQAFGARPEERGYWFIRGFALFIFWPKTGQVARVGFASFDDVGKFPISIDDRPATIRSL